MLIIKVWFHLVAYIQKVFFYLIYGSKVKIGKNTTWRRGFSIMKTASARVEIGANCFFNNDCSINANCLVKIGEGTLLGENVKIYDHNHRFNMHKKLKDQGFSNGTVMIGERCWIGSNVTILKGAEIGNNCVISAGCLISRKIADNSIVRPNQEIEIEEIIYRDEKGNERY